MIEKLSLLQILKYNHFSNIQIDQIINYLETLDYDLKKTRFIGKIISKNERLAKYFFFRDKLKIEVNSIDESMYLNEILDACLDWSEFWRLLVIKKGFCCIRLSRTFRKEGRFCFFYGKNILSGPTADFSDSIFEDVDF